MVELIGFKLDCPLSLSLSLSLGTKLLNVSLSFKVFDLANENFWKSPLNILLIKCFFIHLSKPKSAMTLTPICFLHLCTSTDCCFPSCFRGNRLSPRCVFTHAPVVHIGITGLTWLTILKSCRAELSSKIVLTCCCHFRGIQGVSYLKI